MDTTQVLGQEYRRRVIDDALNQGLRSAGAVIIEGARATGKTMTALNAAGSYAFIDDDAVQQTLAIAPGAVLEGPAPRLLDEWQTAPQLWNLVRRAVDKSTEPGQFILTGSAVPADDTTRHTGAGRFLRLRQRTMTWREKSGDGPTSVSLTGLFNGERPVADMTTGCDIDQLIEFILQPGFPAMTSLTPKQSAERLRNYIDDVARTDIRRLAEVRHAPDVITALIAGLARSVASEVSFSTLAADVRPVAPGINAETISTYVELLHRLFIVEPQPAWTPQLRSRARLRTSPKLHLADSALTAASLRSGPQQLKNDLGTLGLLFESAVVHDLTVLASAMGGHIRHYRDSNGKEIDAIITLDDGRWAAVEVKLGGAQADAGRRSLTSAIEQIDTSAVGDPTFRLVVAGTGPVLTADDGTVVSPLHALSP